MTYMFDDWHAKLQHETTPAEIKKYERRYLSDVPRLGIPTVRARSIDEHRPPLPAVYFVLAPIVNRVKIGHSRGVASRFRSLRECATENFHFLGWIPGGLAVERAFHDAYADERRHGEWFEATDELRARFSKAYGINWEIDPLFS